MTLKNILAITLISIFLFSCNSKSLNSNTELYKIEIKKAEKNKKEYKSYIEEGGKLNIKSERITLKELFALLMKTDEKNIKFKNKQFENEYFNILIEQKKIEEPIGRIVFTKILEKWELKFTEEKYKSYEIKVKDSIKFNNHKNNSTKNNAEIFVTLDSIKIKNCDLKNITELLNSEFSEEFIFNNAYTRIDYNWKKNSFVKTKLNLERNLGISFQDRKEDKSIFTIENN